MAILFGKKTTLVRIPVSAYLFFWFRNIAVVEESLWGRYFVFIPSPQVAQGVQGRKGER